MEITDDTRDLKFSKKKEKKSDLKDVYYEQMKKKLTNIKNLQHRPPFYIAKERKLLQCTKFPYA